MIFPCKSAQITAIGAALTTASNLAWPLSDRTSSLALNTSSKGGIDPIMAADSRPSAVSMNTCTDCANQLGQESVLKTA